MPRRARLFHAAPPGAGGRGADRAKSPRQREERKGPRADAPEQGDRGLPALHRADPRPAGGARRQEGPGLFRGDRKAGPPGGGDRRRGAGRHDPQLPLAEIHALGRGHLALGAPAAFDPVHPDRRGRGRGRAAGGRRHHRRQHHRGHRFHGARRVRGDLVRRLRRQAETRPCRCWTPPDARRTYLARCHATRPSPPGWKWSRTRACWPRSRGWSNGRWC